MKIIELITEDKIQFLGEESQALIKCVGLEGFKNLVRLHNGASIYIPRVRSLERELRNQFIMNEFDGHNYRELALKYDITETWVREIVKKKGLI